MANTNKVTNGPSPSSPEAFAPELLPDYDTVFVSRDELDAFAEALNAPEALPVTALNDWAPVNQRIRKTGRSGRKKKAPRRTKDETREGFVYTILKWPLLVIVAGWLLVLGVAYLLTRLYIWTYEQAITWRGERQSLRDRLNACTNYADWQKEATKLDEYLGNEVWKHSDAYAYYDDVTIRQATEQMRVLREQAASCADGNRTDTSTSTEHAMQELRHLVEACSKSNFVGIENPRLYSETYYGTKKLAQAFIDELEASLDFLLNIPSFPKEDKLDLSRHLAGNLGCTALCLSGGAGFAYYHFGVAKALLDADLLPEVITGTSGGALVAALLGTRTNTELKDLLVPALAYKISACEERVTTWFPRWWRTGARFDSIDWAEKCSWFCRGSMTFHEAYERTGRILNITCIPSSPHSPSILANHITCPNAVIWSTVLASAAVPGILNPVVLMMKKRDGSLAPYSFGHKWKDGSLRTDIPLRALNLHFNVNFSIVSQVNPHINLFFFSSRGSVGRPVTHRRGRGWRGGFLGSAIEQYIKLDLTKWLKVLRHLELLPRFLGQDWSELFLQRFSGTITIWPQSRASDFLHILSDPSRQRLARMIHAGQLSTFPKLLFVANRMKIERLVQRGLEANRAATDHPDADRLRRIDRSKFIQSDEEGSTDEHAVRHNQNYGLQKRRGSTLLEELKRQGSVFFVETPPTDDCETDKSSVVEMETNDSDML